MIGEHQIVRGEDGPRNVTRQFKNNKHSGQSEICLSFCLPCGWRCWVSDGGSWGHVAVSTWWYGRASRYFTKNLFDFIVVPFNHTLESIAVPAFDRMLIVRGRWLGSSSSIIKGYNMVPMGTGPNSCPVTGFMNLWFVNHSTIHSHSNACAVSKPTGWKIDLKFLSARMSNRGCPYGEPDSFTRGLHSVFPVFSLQRKRIQV